MKLYFWRFSDLQLLLCRDGMNRKQKKSTSIDCCVKFLLGASNHSLYKISDILEKIFCHMSLACHIFCLQTISTHYLARLLHPHQMFSFGRRYKAHLVWWLSRPCWTHFLVEHRALWSRLFPLLWRRVAMTGPVSPCSIGRSFLVEDSWTCDSGLKLVQALRPVPGPLATGVLWNTRQECASILVSASWSATACLFALFLPPHTSKVDRRCSIEHLP